MNVVLVERNAAARLAVERLLRSLGVRGISCFADPEVALLYVLGRLHDVRAVVLNEDDEGAAALLRRLGVVRGHVAAISYSGRKLAAAARDRGCGLEGIARDLRRRLRAS